MSEVRGPPSRTQRRPRLFGKPALASALLLANLLCFTYVQASDGLPTVGQIVQQKLGSEVYYWKVTEAKASGLRKLTAMDSEGDESIMAVRCGTFTWVSRSVQEKHLDPVAAIELSLLKGVAKFSQFQAKPLVSRLAVGQNESQNWIMFQDKPAGFDNQSPTFIPNSNFEIKDGEITVDGKTTTIRNKTRDYINCHIAKTERLTPTRGSPAKITVKWTSGMRLGVVPADFKEGGDDSNNVILDSSTLVPPTLPGGFKEIMVGDVIIVKLRFSKSRDGVVVTWTRRVRGEYSAKTDGIQYDFEKLATRRIPTGAWSFAVSLYGGATATIVWPEY